MDTESYREFIGKLQREEQRPVALNDIKNLLTCMPADEAANTLKNIGISPIFNCLKATDKAQFDLTCEILTMCFERFNPGDIIINYTGHVMFLLRHDKSCLRKLAVNEVFRWITSTPNALPVADYIDVFVAIAQMVSDSDVGIANKAILVTSHLPKEVYPKILDEMKIALELNSSSRCNALEVVINISSNSPELLELAAEHGYINFLLSELNSTDILYQLNIMELLSRLAITPHGIRYLVQHGALQKISDSIGDLKSNPMGSLLLPGYMKFFGCVAHLYPKEVLEKYPILVQCVHEAFESRDQTVLPVALDTLGFIGSTIEGKLSLAAIGSQYTQALDKVCEYIRTGSTEIKIRAVACLANLISVTSDSTSTSSVDPRVSLMTREWFRGLSKVPGPTEVLLTMCKNPFMDIRMVSFQLLDAVCGHKWGEEMIAQTAGFIEYLLDRTVDHTKESKEAKFEIIKRLCRSSSFDASTLLRLNKYVEEGPFFTESALEVAMEEGD